MPGVKDSAELRERKKQKCKLGILGRESADVKKRWVCACGEGSRESVDFSGLVPLWRENVHNESSA